MNLFKEYKLERKTLPCGGFVYLGLYQIRKKPELLANNFYDLLHPSAQTIERPVEPEVRRNILQNSASLLKKPTRFYFLFWLELMLKAGILDEQKLGNLMTEATELLSIFAVARKNSKISK